MLDGLDTELVFDASEALQAGMSILTLEQLAWDDALDPSETVLSSDEWLTLTSDEQGRTMHRADSCPVFVSDDPSEDLAGYAPDRFDASLLAEELEADELANVLPWLHRCDVTAADVARWTVDPEANMTQKQKTARAEARADWRTDQLRLRKVQLHRLLQTWFGRADYRACTVTVWIADETQPKGVRPEQRNVLAWIASRIEEKGGDELAGIASCAALMRRRLARRVTPSHRL